MRDWLLGFHSLVSSLFILAGIYILTRSLLAGKKQYTFSDRDEKLSRLYIILLYIQCALGVVLYFQYHFASDTPPSATAGSAGTRFWVISHFSVMFFTLILSQIGRIFIKSSKNSLKKFGYTSFYYGISFIFILISAIFTFL